VEASSGSIAVSERWWQPVGWHYFADAYGVLQESSAPRADEKQSGILAIPQAWFSTGDAKPVRDLMRDLKGVNRCER